MYFLQGICSGLPELTCFFLKSLSSLDLLEYLLLNQQHFLLHEYVLYFTICCLFHQRLDKKLKPDMTHNQLVQN